MKPEFQTLLIAAVFISQIVVISFAFPLRTARYYALLFTRYPSRDYPRLYPVAQAELERKVAIYRPFSFAIGVAGLVTLALGVTYLEQPLQLARLMLLFIFAQILPAIFRATWEIKLMRAFRRMPPPSVRSAELRQWRVADFISPSMIFSGIAASVLALACAALALVLNPHDIVRIVWCSLISGAALLRMLYLLFGSVTFDRGDPYMAKDDVFRGRQLRLRVLFLGSAILGVYFSFMLVYGAHLVHVDFVYVCAIISVLYQILMLRDGYWRFRMFNSRDFSVYRSENGAQSCA